MPEVSPGDSNLTGGSPVAGRVGSSLDWLRQAGQLVVGTGCLQSGSTTLALHTAFGPAGQDKETNQDYALAWSGSRAPAGGEAILALALADGVTSSYRSEWASELACAVALRSLVEHLQPPTCSSPPFSIPGERVPPTIRAAETPTASHLAQVAFTAAGRALEEVGKALEAKPEASCPPGQFLSTWKYILRRGVLLQTTLTLAWLREAQFHLFMVGDGGVLWRTGVADASARDEVLAAADLSTNEVHVLGPHIPEPAFDLRDERPWTGTQTCALFSDGIGRAIQKAQVPLLDRLAALRMQGVANPPLEFICRTVAAGEPAYDDNLTLALLGQA